MGSCRRWVRRGGRDSARDVAHPRDAAGPLGAGASAGMVAALHSAGRVRVWSAALRVQRQTLRAVRGRRGDAGVSELAWRGWLAAVLVTPRCDGRRCLLVAVQD